MSLHADLLDQADALATMDARRPRQANLRRAVSSAYYALFHLLSEAAARQIAGGGRRHLELRHAVRRTFGHGAMKSVAKGFASGTPNAAWQPALGGTVSPALGEVAEVFVLLQEARHSADYDVARTFARREATALVAQARAVSATWREVAGTEEARVFLVALSLQGSLRS